MLLAAKRILPFILLFLCVVMHAQVKDSIEEQLSTIQLEHVEIKGHLKKAKTSNVSITLQSKDLDKLKGETLGGIVKNISGVTLLQTGASIAKPMINGMHSNRILILNNGIRQEGQQWGAEHAPEIDPYIAQSVTVIKGAESVRYGSDAVGGVILVEPAILPIDSSIHAEINLGGASNGRSVAGSAMLEGNIKKYPAFSWRVQGSTKRSGNYKTKDYFLNNTGVAENNYSLALGYNQTHFNAEIFYSRFHTDLGIFEGAHIGSLEDLKARVEHGRPFSDGSFFYKINAPRQKVIHDLLKTKIHFHINDFLHLNVLYGLQHDGRQEYDIRRAGRTSLPALDLSLQSHQIDLSVDYWNHKSLKAYFGTSVTHQNNKSIPGTFANPVIPNFVSQGLGIFAIAKLLRTNYELEAGARYDYKYLNALGYNNKLSSYYGGEHSFTNFSGNLGITWYPERSWIIRSNVGTAWRPPTANELYSNGLHHGSAAVEYGDSSMGAENSVKWITSFNYSTESERLNVQADFYAHYFQHYIFLKPTNSYFESTRGAFPVFQYDQTNARFIGVDIRAQVYFSNYFDYTVKASLLSAKDVSNNVFLPLIPSGRLEHALRAKYNQAGFFKENYIELAHVFVAKQNRYQDGDDFVAPPEAYSLINLGFGTELNFKKHSFNVHFSVNNLANNLYKDYLNRFRYYAHDIGRNFVFRITYRI